MFRSGGDNESAWLRHIYVWILYICSHFQSILKIIETNRLENLQLTQQNICQRRGLFELEANTVLTRERERERCVCDGFDYKNILEGKGAGTGVLLYNITAVKT